MISFIDILVVVFFFTFLVWVITPHDPFSW